MDSHGGKHGGGQAALRVGTDLERRPEPALTKEGAAVVDRRSTLQFPALIERRYSAP
jgi:hypothetical protein